MCKTTQAQIFLLKYVLRGVLMKKEMILDLVFSGKCYDDRINMNDNESYNKFYEDMEQKFKKLYEDMPKEEKDSILRDIDLLQAGMESAVSEEYFKEGFKLGMLIAAQSFLDK